MTPRRFNVAKVPFGAIRDFRVVPGFRLGVGGLCAFNVVPETLPALHRGQPGGAMAFIRLKVDIWRDGFRAKID